MARQTSDEDEDTGEATHPRATTLLFGHAVAEQTILSAYRSGRVPHAFLLVGPKGIGKATLAYRMARFVLAHPDPAAREVQAATSLALDAKNLVARRIAAQAQPDLLIIERTLNDKGVLHKQIAVDDIRRTVKFFGSTAGEGGWRVAIVDAVDELNWPRGTMPFTVYKADLLKTVSVGERVRFTLDSQQINTLAPY